MVRSSQGESAETSPVIDDFAFLHHAPLFMVIRKQMHKRVGAGRRSQAAWPRVRPGGARSGAWHLGCLVGANLVLRCPYAAVPLSAVRRRAPA